MCGSPYKPFLEPSSSRGPGSQQLHVQVRKQRLVVLEALAQVSQPQVLDPAIYRWCSEDAGPSLQLSPDLAVHRLLFLESRVVSGARCRQA